ncbi:MAG: VWA domain-containing protein, partial [Terriglobales bacterium]
GLRALTPLTRDRAALERAVRIAAGGSSAPRQDVLTAEQQIDQDIGGRAQAMPAAERANFNRNAAHGTPGGAAAMAAALAKIITDATAAANAESSWSSLTALRALVQALGLLPGRKEVIYYSQWLDINPTTVFMFRAVMHDANRNHVSFYPVDPAGLSVSSSTSQVTKALFQAGGTSPVQPGLSPGPGEAIENVTYAGRLSALSELAGATGGFLSARTNDLRSFMAEIAADVSAHYELTYNPGPLSGAAAFHRITIEIPGHPHWHVRTRKGYYVLPRLPDPVPDGLTPLLVALASPRPPHALALTAAAFVFPRGVYDARVWSAIQVPLGDLDAEPLSAAAAKKNPQLRGRQLVRFELLQTVEDGQGQTVADAGKQFGFAVPQAAMSRAWAPLWAHQLTLPPGAHTFKAGIYQAQSKKAAVLVCRFQVPPPGPVRLGSIALVQTVRSLLHARAGFDPWWYQDVEVVPNLTGILPASRDPRRTLGFYFLAQVPPGTSGAKVRIDFSRARRIFVQTPPFPLPAPDAGGEIRFLANIPLRTFPPGRYQATVTILAAGHRASSSVSFKTTGIPSN